MLFKVVFIILELGFFPMVNLCDRIWYLFKLWSFVTDTYTASNCRFIVIYLTRAHYLFLKKWSQCKRQTCFKENTSRRERRPETFHPLIKSQRVEKPRREKLLVSCVKWRKIQRRCKRVDDPFPVSSHSGHLYLSIFQESIICERSISDHISWASRATPKFLYLSLPLSGATAKGKQILQQINTLGPYQMFTLW